MLLKLLKSLKPQRRARASGVAFLTMGGAPHRFTPGDRMQSSQASVRLRVLIPGRELSRTMEAIVVPFDEVEAEREPASLATVSTVVIAKVTTGLLTENPDYARRLLRWVERHANRYRLVADLSDDYAGMATDLRAPFLAEYQQTLARHCLLTVPCEALRSRLQPVAHRGIHVIEDPWEGDAREPRTPGSGRPLRLAWFGNLAEANAAVVERALASIGRRFRGRGMRLDLVAHEQRRDLGEAVLARAREANPALETAFHPWSLEATREAIDACDVVLLPQDTGDTWRAAKSHNRLVEALRGGRLALASPIPSYVELGDFAWIGDDLADGLEWALAHPGDAARRIAAGQAYVADRFSPQAIAARWRDVLATS